MSTSGREAALAYHEPSIVTILVQSSFLLLLNVLNWALDKLLYCGLIGQILVGIAWGTPGGQILSSEVEHAVVQLGYLGLILLVFEGGLSTSFPALRANIALSLGVAVTGIGTPIGLSFILSELLGATKLQCFAAGAALCSTSLGTTFAVLRASGLVSTRLGVVLTSAAMLDDVVGLVMVQAVSSLGGAGESISATTVLRPVLVSVAFAVVAAIVCHFGVKPATVALNDWRASHKNAGLDKILRSRSTALVFHTGLLVALVTASSYAGTSNLFAAYIAGAAISWWDSEVPHLARSPERSDDGTATTGSHPPDTAPADPSNTTARPSSSPPSDAEATSHHGHSASGSEIFEHYYHPTLKWVLQPLFFGSIGFSVPITQMFSGVIVWKGIVYAVLMFIGKLMCGLWLVRFPGTLTWFRSLIKNYKLDKSASAHGSSTQATASAQARSQDGVSQTAITDADISTHGISTARSGTAGPDSSDDIALRTIRRTQASAQGRPVKQQHTLPNPPKPLSLYPAAIIGLAMVPRGEIGFLISAVAQGNGMFGGDSSGESDIFLVVTWAIVLCTLIGPLCVGLLVRRVRKLEGQATTSARRQGNASSRDVLGVWGLQ